ncbi:MAG: hypothetical protein M3211_03660 [Actinomycetota bacterium]|nr:hypothetical protein [Actinomycetota bacterium]
MTCRQQGCGCDPVVPPEPGVGNAPGQPVLEWRVAPYSHTLARLRARLGEGRMPPEVRALAGNDSEDPAVALLDAFAVVADTVSFYTERIAQEGFLRSATELESVRMLARTIGYELRPGVSAAVDLAFDVEDAPGAPTAVDVPVGTPVQSVPAAGQLPQTFETSEDLRARSAWNVVPGVTSEPAVPVFGDTGVWLHGTSLGIRPGDAVLVVGEERRRFGRTPDHSRASGTARRDDERWEFRPVTAVTEPTGTLTGWTYLTLERRVGWRRGTPLTPAEGVVVHAFDRRANLFGAQAPDPGLITGATGTGGDWTGIDDPRAPGSDGNPVPNVIEVDGDQARIVVGSWLVLERAGNVELYGVEDADPSGAARFGVSGKLTRVRVDVTENLDGFGRRGTRVHCEPRVLPAGLRPLVEPVPSPDSRRILRLAPTEPPLPVGRRVVVTGFPPGGVPEDPLVRQATSPPQAEAATVAACVVEAGTMQVTLDRELALSYDPATLRVRANVVAATHGETVEQVLGSGDATTTFQRMRTRRAPLTHVRAPTASGARSTLEVRVDGVVWPQVPSLDAAAPTDRALVARAEEDATVVVTSGDGVHGARLPTGAENVAATYRVGIGSAGALVTGQLTLLPRRPFGIRSVVNPAPAHDWADSEGLTEARVNAPLRTRTLDRAVSVADHADFAGGFAGVSLARADAVWDGRETVVLVSLLGAAGQAVSAGLVADLSAALVAARDPGSRCVVLPGELVRFGVRVELAVDPTYVRADVETAVRDALVAGYAAPGLPFTTAVAASRVLVTVRAVDGVLACTVPRLAAVTSPVGAPPVLSPPAGDVDLLSPLPGRWEKGPPARLVPAQAAGLVPGAVQIGVMAS